MNLFMHDRLGLSWEEIPTLRRHYLETYGTTLRGLQKYYQVDTDEYLAYVHDLQLNQYLQPDPAVRTMLFSLPQKKWVFTNADADHARRVLTVLELSDCFHGLIDVRALKFTSKPEKETYYRALNLAGSPEPSQCVLLDDSPRNLSPAREIGFTTILVSKEAGSNAADFSIPQLTDLPLVLPTLWDEDSL
jgi:pyrimidine 5'-nucleotidase